MALKQGKEFWDEVKKAGFHEFMQLYTMGMHDYVTMMAKVMACVEEGEDASKNHYYKMRQKTIDLEKFGKQFRERTILMQKEE